MAKTVKKKITSKFEFTKVKRKDVDLKVPVCVVMEWNDGYHVIMLRNKHTNKLDEKSVQGRGPDMVSCQNYDTLEEFLREEGAGGDDEETFDEWLDGLYGRDSNLIHRSIIKVTKLTGKYGDPDNIVYP